MRNIILLLALSGSWSLAPAAMAGDEVTVYLTAKGTIVWRGVAQAELQPDAQDKQREAKIREAVRDLLKRFPPKK